MWSGHLGLLLELNAVVDIKTCRYVGSTVLIRSCGVIFSSSLWSMKSMYYWIIKLYLKKKLNGKNKEKIKAEVERLKRNISQTYDFYSSHKLSLGLNYAMHRLKKIPIRL